MAEIKKIPVISGQTFSYEGKLYGSGDELMMDERDFIGLTDPSKPEAERIKLSKSDKKSDAK